MLLNILRTLFICFFFVITIDSSHFLGGTITWRIQNVSDNGTSVAILITQTYAWTYVAGRCNGSSIANNLPVSGAGGSLGCLPSCPPGFGTVSAIPYCTDVSPLNGIAVGQRLDTVVIPIGSNFFVIYSGSSWNTQIAGASDWSVTSHINLVRRPDNNMFNNAPVATVMSPTNIQVNQTTTIHVSVSDADADMVRCRWASKNSSNGVDECGSVCPPHSLPANTILNSNCIIIITGSTVGAMYAVTFIVEDFISSSSTSPLSSMPVQFFVKVIAPPSCSNPPEVVFVGPSCVPVTVNQTFTSQLLGINHCGANDNISDIATLSFSGMHQSSLTHLNSSHYYKNLTWTPTIAQLGYQVMCAMALSSLYVQSSQYCFTFYVTEDGTQTCPGFINNNTTMALISTTTTTHETIDWAVIASISALVSVVAIICSSCIVYRYYKRSSGKRRLKFYNNSSLDNASPLVSTRIHPPIDVSVDPIYTVRNETVNNSAISSIPSVDEKVNDDDVEQIFEPRILYPRNNTVPIRFGESILSMQSNRTSAKTKNEIIYVKNVPLSMEQMITETRPSQIETIDLSPISAKSQQLSEVNVNSVEPLDIFQSELTNVTRSDDKTLYTFTILEVPVEKPRTTKVKHKKSSGIHVTIRKSSRQKP